MSIDLPLGYPSVRFLNDVSSLDEMLHKARVYKFLLER
jgi:hypothetical protein